ncbi:MAG: 4-phosphopantoate--beta-alanine ligase, partial [Deltaproteobacteria bacterium]|nr:4-phosphopantoate--beta-alanine ligase [Deltaproteobacteria bacterium]
LSRSLAEARRLVAAGMLDSEEIISVVTKMIAAEKAARIDYVKICHQQTLADQAVVDDDAVLLLAVFIGKTRLIDNSFLRGKSGLL